MRLAGLGDLVLAIPAIRSIRLVFPKADITVLVKKGLGELISSTSYADNVWETPVSREGLGGILRFVLQLRKHRFDLAMDLLSSSDGRSALILALAKSPCKAGYDVGWRSFCLNMRVPPPGEGKYEVENVLDVVRVIAGDRVDSSLLLPVESKAQESIDQRLK